MILHEGRMHSIKESLRGPRAAAQSGQVRIAIRAGEGRPYGTSCALAPSRTTSPLINIISTACTRVICYCNKLFLSFSSPVPVTFGLLSYHTKEDNRATKTAKL